MTVSEIKEKNKIIGGVINAFTTPDYTSYFIYCLESSAKKAIEYLYNIVFNTQFMRDQVETERKVVLEEIRMRDGSGYTDIINTIYAKNNPYLKNVGGKDNSVMAITINDLKHHNECFYKVEEASVVINCTSSVISIVKRTVEKMEKKLIREALRRGSRLKNNECADNTDVMLLCNKYDYKLHIEKLSPHDTQNTKCFMTFSTFNTSDPRYLFLNFVAYAFSKTLLFRVLREKKGWVYTIPITNECQKHVGRSCVFFETRNTDIVNVVKLILRLLKKYSIDCKLPNDEFKKIKIQYLKNFKYKITDNEYFMDFYSSQTGANMVTHDEYISRIEDMTNKQFCKLSAEVFDVHKMGLLILSKHDETELTEYVMDMLKTHIA
jgi:predicted Zn-dependent peptidase